MHASVCVSLFLCVCVSLFILQTHTSTYTVAVSVAQSCPTLCNPMDFGTSKSFTISRSLLKLTSFESMMPSNHLIFCHTHRHMFFHTHKHLYAHKHSLSLSYTHTHTHTYISSSSTKMLRLFQALSSHYHEEVAFTPSLEPWGTEESSS